MKNISTLVIVSLFILLSLTVLPMAACNGSKNSQGTNGTTTNGVSSQVSLATSTQTTSALDAKELIDQYCAGCHNESGCDSPPILRVGFPAPMVEGMIRAGNGWGMPSFQGDLSEDQIAAIVAYLSGGPAVELPPATDTAGQVANLYCYKCCVCHGKNRQGVTGPALTPQTLAGIGKGVLKDTINNGVPGTAMPPWKGILSDQQIDDLIGYILSPVQ